MRREPDSSPSYSMQSMKQDWHDQLASVRAQRNTWKQHWEKKKEKPQQKRHLNQLPKGDQKVGYKTADTAHILLPATISISPYSKREALSRRAQQLLSQRQLGRSQPLCFIQTRPNRMSEPLRILRFSLETYQTKYLPQPTVPMDWHNIILPPVATNSLQGFFFSRQQQTRHSEDNTTISLSLCGLLHDNIWTGHLKFFFVQHTSD